MKSFVRVIGLLIFVNTEKCACSCLTWVCFFQLHASRSFAFLRFVGISKWIDTTMKRATLWEKTSDPVSRRKAQSVGFRRLFSIITEANELCVQRRSTREYLLTRKSLFLRLFHTFITTEEKSKHDAPKGEACGSKNVNVSGFGMWQLGFDGVFGYDRQRFAHHLDNENILMIKLSLLQMPGELTKRNKKERDFIGNIMGNGRAQRYGLCFHIK